MKINDSIGSFITVDPTLKADGFAHIDTFEPDKDERKRLKKIIAEYAEDCIDEKDFNLVVYFPWTSRDGWSFYCDVYAKLEN